jgi:peptide/nickel transport system permease protein
MISFVFILIRLAPGDPSQKFISPKLSPELVEKVKESFQLNTPVIKQYVSFIKNFLSGDLGFSYNYRKPVTVVLGEFLPFTLIFASISIIIQVIASIILAFIVSRRLNRKLDRVLSKFSIAAYMIPTFVLGLILIYIFSFKLNLFPSSGISSFDLENKSNIYRLYDYILHLVLPVCTLSVGGTAILYKYLRDNIEDVFNKNFILYLRANGYAEKEIFKNHIIPNAINPFITVSGVELGLLLGGALITEVIFGLPGMGRLTLNAIIVRDYPLVVGCTLTASILMLLSNFLADLAKAFIDKRYIKGLT